MIQSNDGMIQPYAYAGRKTNNQRRPS